MTQKEIDEGTRTDSGRCMISEAIKRAYPEAANVLTDLQFIRVSWPERGIRAMYPTPPLAQVNLYKFDEGMQPEPFEFRSSAVRIVKSRAKAAKNAKNAKNIPTRREVRVTQDAEEVGTPKVRIVGGKLPKSGALNDNFRFTTKRKFGLRALAHVWEKSSG